MRDRGWCAALTALAVMATAAAQERPRLHDAFELVPGFVAERKNEFGFAIGYTAANPWGEYTAYLLATNSKGQRTWRIEQYQEMPGIGLWQGSSMYLLEGSRQALLIDTGQPSHNTSGINDLKAVVRHLLSHEDDGNARGEPLDFVVANTHNHPDHVGENAQMSDRAVFYMDGDWPHDAPENYVPIREGGGRSRNGPGKAVSEIDLGDRLLKAIAIPPHTAGSTAYLDTENRIFITGDALGSAWPWLHWARIADYAEAMNHVAALTRDVPGITVLPAHFYQIDAYGRRDGIPGYQYILDQQASAHGIVNGTIEGEPAFLVGPTVYWGGTGSARITYSLGLIDAKGGAPVVDYRAVRIPGTSWKREWVWNPAHAKLFDIKGELHLIHGSRGENLFLVKGSRAALLIISSAIESDLAGILKRLAGETPLEVIALHDGLAATGTVKSLGRAKVLPAVAGDVIDLGIDSAGRPLRLEVHALRPNIHTLLSIEDRLLFANDASAITEPPAAWRRAVEGRYDLVYSGRSDKWFTPASELTGSAPLK